VAREPTPLAVFYLHFLMRWFKFCFTLCSEYHSSFLIVVKNDLTYYMIFNKNVLFPVDVAAFQLLFLPDSGHKSRTCFDFWGQLKAAAKQKLVLNHI
jgi:hypothetical protein